MLRIEYTPLDDLKRHPRNPKDHDLGAISRSVNRFGFTAPVMVDERTGYLAAGHGRIDTLAQLKAQGNEPPANVQTNDAGEWLVPVVRGVAFNSDAEIEAYLVADNRLTILGGWNEPELASLLQDLAAQDTALLEATGYDGDDLQALLDDLGMNEAGPEGDAAAVLNRAEELREKYGVERGQLWIIGRHRVLCGDSYSVADIDRLRDGKQPDMLHTDPPYGINIVQPRAGGSAADSGGAKPFGSTASTDRKGAAAVAFRNSGKRAERGHVQHGKPSRNQIAPSNEYLVMRGDVGRGNPANIIQSNLYPVIEGDDRPFDPAPFLGIAPITVLWGANYFADSLPPSSCWICWDKREDITRNNFADCELAWTSMNKPARVFHHLWNGLHKGSQNGQRRIHPTEKPVALFAEIGRMFSDKGLWLDLFAGSGAQIEAAERNGATCYALEYEPLYVASILQRLADMGLEPRLVTDDGRP